MRGTLAFLADFDRHCDLRTWRVADQRYTRHTAGPSTSDVAGRSERWCRAAEVAWKDTRLQQLFTTPPDLSFFAWHLLGRRTLRASAVRKSALRTSSLQKLELSRSPPQTRRFHFGANNFLAATPLHCPWTFVLHLFAIVKSMPACTSRLSYATIKARFKEL